MVPLTLIYLQTQDDTRKQPRVHTYQLTY
uniref:Uncharacterized protein n=1 Tax=Anguilla anguilla TaxID=7936 RepID=A0A0E9SD11_ANGAN